MIAKIQVKFTQFFCIPISRQPSYFSLPVNVMHRTVIEFIISHALDDIFYTFPRDVTVFRSPFVPVFACMIDERHRRVTRYNMCTRSHRANSTESHYFHGRSTNQIDRFSSIDWSRSIRDQ